VQNTADLANVNSSQNNPGFSDPVGSDVRSGQPMSLKEIIDANRDRIIIASVSNPEKDIGSNQVKQKVVKGIKM
jgi:hypothetical protein